MSTGPAELWGGDRKTARRLQRFFGSFTWATGIVIAPVALVIAIIGVTVTALTGHVRLPHAVTSLIPYPARVFFQSSTDIVPVELSEAVKEGAKRAAPPPVQAATAGFTLGSSEDTVRAVQGRPTTILGSTWYYGDSEVYFAAGRVVGWKNSSKNPLKTR